jgi:hypothetical protein
VAAFLKGYDFFETKLWQMNTDEKPGRSSRERAPFDEEIDLVAEPADPRDLFGLLPAGKRRPLVKETS